MSSAIDSLGIKYESKQFQYKQTLNRKEAKERLRRLVPRTLEHTKLQDALTRIEGIVEISLPTCTYKVNTVAEEDRLLGGFGSSEHVAIGESIVLQGLNGDKIILKVGGSIDIEFKHIVALAGDFYALAGQAISLLGGTNEEKTSRFQQAFETIQGGDPEQIRKVINAIENECHSVRHNGFPHHCYSKQMVEKNREIKKIKNDIDDLLVDNSDHFSLNAEEAYRIGHTLAIRLATEAGNEKNIEKLRQAYAMDGFACHFLTDLFASGHIRNQRGPLEKFLEKLGFGKIPVLSNLPILNKALSPKVLAGILTGAQHQIDGDNGLNVTNAKGEYWRAYGDGWFFNSKNDENSKKAKAATQQSVDEVYQAYAKIHPSDSVYDHIPHATDQNPLPLYFINQNEELFLHKGSESIQIRTRQEYIDKGIAQALSHLPDGYINGFLDDAIGISNLHPHPITQALTSQVTRLTGRVWQVAGLATFNQVKQANQQINEKLDEIGDELKAIHNLNIRIIQHVQASQLHLLEDAIYKDIRKPILSINSVSHSFESYSNDELNKKAEKMQSERGKIASIFLNGTPDGKILLELYKAWLSESGVKDQEELKIAVTQWFRHHLNYQVKAFNLYVGLKIKACKDPKTQEDLFKEISQNKILLEDSLTKQIVKNKNYIDEELIYGTDSYNEFRRIVAQMKRLKPTLRPQLENFITGLTKSTPEILDSKISIQNGDALNNDIKKLLEDKLTWLNSIYAQPDIAPIMDLVKWKILGLHNKMYLTSDFSKDSFLSICIDGKSKETQWKNNTLQIGISSALHLGFNSILGIIVRELTRIVIDEVFENDGNPYYNSPQEKQRFAFIVDSVEKNKSKVDSLLQEVFNGTFMPSRLHQELLIRVPQIVMTDKDTPAKRGDNNSNSIEKEFLSYYQYHFLPIIKAHSTFCLENIERVFPNISNTCPTPTQVFRPEINPNHFIENFQQKNADFDQDYLFKDGNIKQKNFSFEICGKAYYTLETRGDGACGLHALIGNDNQGVIYYSEGDSDPGIAAKIYFRDKLLSAFENMEIRESFVNVLSEMFKRDDTHPEKKMIFLEEPIKEKYLRQRNEENRQDIRIEGEKIAEGRVWVDLLTDQICNLIKQNNSVKYSEYPNAELIGYLKTNPIKMFDILYSSHQEKMQYHDLLNNENKIKVDQAAKKVNAEEERKSKSHEEFLLSEHVVSWYLECMLRQNYYLSQEELKLAAQLFKIRLRIFTWHHDKYIDADKDAGAGGVSGDETQSVVIVAHRGVHYERVTPAK